MSILNQILTATFFVSSISLVGGLLLIWKKLLTDKYASYFVGFAAGVMLVTAFLDLMPEALEKSQDIAIFISILSGILIFFFMERFVLWFHHHDDMHESKPSSFLILLGDGFHNVFDGIAIAAAFMVSPTVGITTTIAIAAHEIPQEIADFSILVLGGMKKRDALFYNFLSALTAFAGAIGGYYFLHTIQNALPMALAFTAGMFIYIACSDLIPDMHQDFKKQKRWLNSIPFMLGIVISYLFIALMK